VPINFPKVQRFTVNGVPIAAFGIEGSNPGEFYIPSFFACLNYF